MNARAVEQIDHDPETGEIKEVSGTDLAILGASSMTVEIARAEIDQQIATARKYPRQISRVVQNILSLATMDQEAAEECMYALPRGGKPIVGPSIRLAEIVVGQWGNCRTAARVTEVNKDGKYVEAEGVFHDLETNMARKATVRRRIVDKNGRLFNDDMIIVTGNAACAIAIRNAILAGVPRAVWRKAYEGAEQAVRGDIKTLAERRSSAFRALAAFGVKPEQVFALLEVKGEDDITLEHMPTLIGTYQALKSGDKSVEELFDPRKTGLAHAKVVNPLDDKGGDDEDDKAPDEATAGAAKEAAARGVPDKSGAPAEKAKDGDGAAAATTPAATGAKPAGAPAEQAGKGGSTTSAEYLAGRAARMKDMALRAVPGELREEGAEARRADWERGWKDQDKATAKTKA